MLLYEKQSSMVRLANLEFEQDPTCPQDLLKVLIQGMALLQESKTSLDLGTNHKFTCFNILKSPQSITLARHEPPALRGPADRGHTARPPHCGGRPRRARGGQQVSHSCRYFLELSSAAL